jgi:hypothetical protein
LIGGYKVIFGPMASYALLGAELVKTNADGLEAIVFVNSKGGPYAPFLVLMPDVVRVGLLEE